jgi:hypothetical protein
MALAGLTEKTKIYRTMHDAMLKHHYGDRQEECEALVRGWSSWPAVKGMCWPSFSQAEKMLENDDLPILIRAHCHMMLSCGDHPLAVEHAETAVKVLDGDARYACSRGPFWYPLTGVGRLSALKAFHRNSWTKQSVCLRRLRKHMNLMGRMQREQMRKREVEEGKGEGNGKSKADRGYRP